MFNIMISYDNVWTLMQIDTLLKILDCVCFVLYQYKKLTLRKSFLLFPEVKNVVKVEVVILFQYNVLDYHVL